MFSNPADIFMRVLSINYPKMQEDTKKLELLNISYQENQRGRVDAEILRSRIPDFDLFAKRRYRASICKQLNLLWGRNSLFSLREPQVIFAQLGVGVFNGVLMIFIFYGVASQPNNPVDV
jgi:hypothetical protein